MSRIRSRAERSGQLDLTSPEIGMAPTVSDPERLTHGSMQLVIQTLRARGLEGATAAELSKLLGVTIKSIGPRLSDLRANGLVRKTEAKRAGATVWITTANGRQAP